MGRKGFVLFVAGASLLAIVSKYVYLVIPALLTIGFALIIHRRRLRNQREQGFVYVRRRIR